MVEKKFSLKHVIKNAPTLVDEYSQQEEHFGVPWRIRCKKSGEKFALSLRCERESDETQPPWSVDVSFYMRLVAVCGEDDFSPELSHKFTGMGGWGWRGYKPWKTVISDHMINNRVTVHCHVTIEEMSGIAPKRNLSFDDPSEHLEDMVVVKIGEQKFNILRSLLAFRSPYFHALFFGNFSESNESEVELKEVDPDDFQCLLEVIYGESVIQMEMVVEGVLKLADQFDVAMVREKCEEFLMKTDRIGKRTKFRLADKYELEKLKSECLQSITTAEDLNITVPSDLTGLNYSTMQALLEKSLDFH